MAEKFIQSARASMKRRGTVGSFTKYCGGEVTCECISRALKSGNNKLIKRAAFAKAMQRGKCG